MLVPTRVLVATKMAGRYLTELSSLLTNADVSFHDDPALAPLSDIEVVIGWSLSNDLIRKLTRLKWLHVTGGGVDQFTLNCVIGEHVVITRTGSPAYAPTIAQYVLAHVLASSQNVCHYARQQLRCEWKQHESSDFNQLSIGLVGHGGVGKAIARLLKAAGCSVTAFRREAVAAREPYPVYCVQELPIHIRTFDWLVLAMPFTRETANSVNKATFGAMKNGASLINVARSGLVVESDLLAALESGRIGQAVLDVFTTEPLPAASAFWQQKGVTITPHVAGSTDIPISAREFAENLRRFRDNEPLLNTVNRSKGY